MAQCGSEWKQLDWSLTLYRSADGYVLSVLCAGVGLYLLNLPLTEDEARRHLVDAGVLAELAAFVRSAPHRYAARSVELDDLNREVFIDAGASGLQAVS